MDHDNFDFQRGYLILLAQSLQSLNEMDLLNLDDGEDGTALHMIVMNPLASAECIDLFARYGADLNTRRILDGATPLSLACSLNRHDLIQKLLICGASTGPASNRYHCVTLLPNITIATKRLLMDHIEHK